MARFLSQEWIDDITAAAAGVELPAEASIVVGQLVTDAPDGDVSYRFGFTDGHLDVKLAPVDDADIVLIQDYATAVAIARGELAAQEAVADGRLKLRGDVGALVRNGPAVAATAAIFARVRDRTTF